MPLRECVASDTETLASVCWGPVGYWSLFNDLRLFLAGKIAVRRFCWLVCLICSNVPVGGKSPSYTDMNIRTPSLLVKHCSSSTAVCCLEAVTVWCLHPTQKPATIWSTVVRVIASLCLKWQEKEQWQNLTTDKHLFIRSLHRAFPLLPLSVWQQFSWIQNPYKKNVLLRRW